MNTPFTFPVVTADDIKLLWQTVHPAPAGEKVLGLLQSCADHTTAAEFEAFEAGSFAAGKNVLLHFYDRAFEKVFCEVFFTTVEPGQTVLWYLYNSGYIIKTPAACFGVDLHHRMAAKLAPLLDFVIATHNHDDHYNLALLNSLTENEKAVVSNFFPNPFYTKAVECTYMMPGNVTLHCGEADHSAHLRKFTMPVEIICKTGNAECVIYTSGDCYSHEFLAPKSKAVDLYIIHPRCGMKPVEGVEKVNARLTLVSHLLEMSHEIDRYRWPLSFGKEVVEDLKKINREACFPVWGQKIVWNSSGKVSFS